MRISKVTSFLLIILIAGMQYVSAQETPTSSRFKTNKDLAIAQLRNFPNPDTNRINALAKVMATPVYLKEREEIMPYRNEAYALSTQLNFEYGLIICHQYMANYYKSASRYAEAIQQFDSVLNLIGDSKLERLVKLRSIAKERKGQIYYSQENYYAALDNFFEALKINDDQDIDKTIRLNNFIVEIYTLLNNLVKAREYSLNNIELTLKSGQTLALIGSYLAHVAICLEEKNYTEASEYLDKIAPSMPDPQEVQLSFGYYLKRGKISFALEKYEEANRYYQFAYKYANAGGHMNSRNIVLRCLSNTAIKLGDYETAKKYALENILLAGELDTKSQRIEALTNLSEYYRAIGDKNTALDLMQQALRLKDSLSAETNLKQINILGAVYDADKQNKEIIRLQLEREKQAAETKHRSFWNRFFIGSIIALLIIGYLGYTNITKGQQIARNNQIIQRQKIIELEKDKQLLVVDAMLRGQEEERSRVAKDLHDGIGSLLSGTKLSFMNVRENATLSPGMAAMFDKSLGMLDHTIGDLRKVAQNLMPEALAKFGLSDTLFDFCDSIQSTTGIKIVYQYFGEQRRLDSTAEVFIYRIVQELVNNIVKHAKATEVIVQLVVSATTAEITVEDNGKGFNADILTITKGNGMANIRHRIEYFNGSMDLATSPGKGTSVNIELKA